MWAVGLFPTRYLALSFEVARDTSSDRLPVEVKCLQVVESV